MSTNDPPSAPGLLNAGPRPGTSEAEAEAHRLRGLELQRRNARRARKAQRPSPAAPPAGAPPAEANGETPAAAGDPPGVASLGVAPALPGMAASAPLTPQQGKPPVLQAVKPLPGAKPPTKGGPTPAAPPASVQGLEPASAAPSPPEAARLPGRRGKVKPPPPGVGVKIAPPTLAELSSRTEVVRKLRRTRMRRLALRVLLFVIVPSVLGVVYYVGIATDQFESRSTFTVFSNEGRSSIALETLIGGIPGSASTRDTLAVREYALSRDMLAKLDKEHQFIAHYQNPAADFLSRLKPDASFEEAYEYFLKKVLVEYDSVAGVLMLRVRAFEPKTAQDFAQCILRHGEAMVNGLNERALNDQTKVARVELGIAEQRLTKARQRLIELQRTRQDLDPRQTAASTLALKSQFEGNLAQAQAELNALKQTRSSSSFEVRAAEAKVQAIAAQVGALAQKANNPEEDEGMAQKLAEFEAAAVEKEFATKAYESALASLEIARAEGSRQHRYLTTISNPSLADESTYPARGWSILTVIVVSFLSLTVGSFVIAAVREHARV